MGDQFIGAERPLALAAELDIGDGLNEDGSLNLEAVHAAVTQIRSMIAGQPGGEAAMPPAWMRGGPAPEEPQGPRRHLMPGAPAPRAEQPDDRPPISYVPESAPKAPPPDPGWKKLKVERPVQAKDPTWIILDVGQDKALAANLEPAPDLGAEPLPPDARLSLIWRPCWVAAGEVIGAYEARIQRFDGKDKPPLEGVNAYPREDELAANVLDRFRIANAIRDFRASESAGNNSTVVVPVHWLTLTAENRMDFLAPFADITPQSRDNRIVIELFGVPSDVKPMILGAAIAKAKELCREVTLRTRLADPGTKIAWDCGASMIGVDLAELAGAERTGDDKLLAALRGFQAQAAKARLGAYLWGVRRRKVIVGAVQGGFAMVNGPALMKDIPRPAKVLPAPKSRFIAG
ncbi:MAG: hypothetical protein NVV74_13175 [Magnetospirillum sp.]|nr:hypothetical protein [Magnetospirillum sp.]